MATEPSMNEVAISFLEEQSKGPPPMLWHYTNTRGMLGILRSGKLWATHTAFLNDASEMKYAGLPLWRTIEKLISETKDLLDRQFLREMRDQLLNSLRHTCVVSFSAIKNELSQWRAYGGESGSFALGFNPAILQKYSSQQKITGFNLYKCVYEDTEHSALCKNFVSAALQEFQKTVNTGEDAAKESPRIYQEAYECFRKIAPLIKHPDFKQEEEWRLVSEVLDLKARPFHFREGKTCAVPYIEFSLLDEQPENTNQAPNCVYLLSGPPQAHSANVLPLGYCADFKLQPSSIEPSLTPYRNV